VRSRPFRVAHIAVDETWVYASDEAFPVVAQVDRRTGEVRRLFWWPMSSQHRDQAASNALVTRPGELWVSSPLAGGLVRIDLQTGATSLVPLVETPGPIAPAGDTLWVVADADWYDLESGGDSQERQAFEPARPIVWADGTNEAARDDDDFDDFSFHLPPRPVWRIDGEGATRVDLGGDVSQVIPTHDDEFLIVVRRPTDPVVKTPSGWGSVGFSYPGVLMHCTTHAAPTPLVELPETSGSLIADGDRYWLSGFGLAASAPGMATPNLFGQDPNPLHEVDIENGTLARSELTIELKTIVDDIAVQIVDRRAHGSGGRAGCEARCFDVDQLSELNRVELSRAIDTWGDTAVRDDLVWFATEDLDTIVWVDPRNGTAGEITIATDLSSTAPAPTPPEGVDLAQFEASQVKHLRESLFGGWTDEDGNTTSFIEGIHFEAIDLKGRFPDAHVVARFRSDARPGVRYARQWNLYDDLGNAEDLEDADIHLMEDIESGGPPSLDRNGRPDSDGTVWF